MPLLVPQTESTLTHPARWRASGLLALALLAGSLGCEEATLKPESATLTASVAPWGGTAFTDDVLTGGGELRHPRNVALASVSWSWSWKLDGVDTGINTQTVPTTSTVKHQLWEVTVRADYGSGDAGPETAEIRIINSVPVITVANTTEWDAKVPAIEPRQQFRGHGRPYLGDTLSVDAPWTDADNDVVTLLYEWTVVRPGTAGGSRPIVVDPTTDTLDTSVPVLVDLPPPDGPTLRAFAVGDLVRVRITPRDDEEGGRAISTSSVRLKLPGSATAPSPVRANAGSGASAGAVLGGVAALRSARSGALVPLAPSPIPIGDAAARQVRSSALVPLPPSPIPVPIGVSEFNVCSIGVDGSLECSGVEDFGLTRPPPGPFFQVAVRPDYGCAIRADDQTIACWGAPLTDLGQLAAPEGPFSQIDLGIDAACGLRAGGEISCWGDDSLGQSSPPEGQFIYLDVSDSYGCAMDADGVVTCWGALE